MKAITHCQNCNAVLSYGEQFRAMQNVTYHKMERILCNSCTIFMLRNSTH